MKQIPLTQGKFAIIDDEDYEHVNQFKWYFEHGYARRDYKIDGKRYRLYMHREIASAKGRDHTDHINGDKLDNRRGNLRVCSASNNCMNSKMSKNNTTGFNGVCFYKRDGVYTAQLMKDRKAVYLGRFKKPEYAAAAYDLATINVFGEYALTNFDWEGLGCLPQQQISRL